MKRTLFILLCLCFMSQPAWSQSTTAAVLAQTAKQTAEHIQRLKQAIQEVTLMKQQLELAIEASRGIGEVDFLSDFRNVIVETTDLLSDLDVYISDTSDLSDQWKDIFGNLTSWVDTSTDDYNYIGISDDINVASYKVADSYQDIYTKNSEYSQRFINHAKTVNEKGAMKQVAEELGHLMQMENHIMYLLSQSVKQQSIENSNRNLERKELVVEQQKENEGVRRFMNSASREYPM
ncbi:MAG: hypothetical protein KC684_01505 [Candidatus Omnitrophica bacterium]|nr:hypothetical protein [Candidatus Omnitrophota bacterium]MCA9408628.1 hypothetical protein [Candidatus Omnitrophota bacterium]